ncbi:MAG: bifunctional DNA-binding transcriptional regulator/O6-methylguanine-DNA methyltransferase Ada [Nitrospinae bacterium]|nr:bifunctional DNA-binding transcriptional regulator/O6-methylguanine-DNA methyltransferase Ada [Nitrospinota bacterium]
MGGCKVIINARWEAILNRDEKSDGRFVYAVRSTGIYCRPSCASRKPRKNNVLIFEFPEMAESRGFRPCLRCAPQDAGYDPRLEKVRKAVRYIEEHADENPTLAELGQCVGLSPHHLQRTFKKVLGVSPRQYLESIKAHKYKDLLKNGRDLAGAGYEAGYGSSRGVYEGASRYLGMTPATYKKGGEGVTIRYGISTCRLGRLLVAATDKGVCRVSIGERVGELVADLKNEYPHSNLIRSDGELKGYLNIVARLASGGSSPESLPLDVRASAFQCRVWERLKSIPPGKTMTYKEIAEDLGLPKGARAVGSACAKNPVALLVPCHRAVRGDGGLAGYRWGVERKRKLLELEKERK